MLQAISAPDFLNKQYPIIPEIVGSGLLVYGGFLIISGDPGVGKSLLVMQLATHIAKGQPWLGHTIDRAHTVLLVQKEMHKAQLQDRLRTQLTGKPVPSNMLVVEDAESATLDPRHSPNALNELVMRVRPNVVILDPLVEFSVGDENDAAVIRAALLAPVRQWQAIGTAVILVHHLNKPSDDTSRIGLNRMRGSTAIGGACDTNIQLTIADAERDFFYLDYPKVRHAKVKLKRLALRRDSNSLLHIRGPADAVLAEIERQGGTVDLSDLVSWAAKAKIGKTTLYEAIVRLVREGELARAVGKPLPGGGRTSDKIQRAETTPLRKSETPLESSTYPTSGASSGPYIQ